MAYNSTTESWAQKADMPTARGWLSACVVDGKIYAIGGAPQNYQAGCYKNVEVYDPSTDTWTRKSDMPTARAAVSTCVVNRRIYATGGFSPAGVFATNEMYNPATDTWITKSSMQQKRLMSFVGSIADKVYVAGGSYPDSQGQPVVLSTLEEYDTGLGKLVFDFNGDGIIDSVDVCMMIDYWATNEPLYDIAPPPFGDGIVDVQDLIVLAEHLFEDTRLIAHWKLDETEGDIAHNSIGDEHGILNGEPVWQPTNGKKGGALEFDGIDDYITTGPVLNPADGAFSVFAWVKGGKPGQVVISQRDTGGETWLGTESTSGKLMTGLMAPPAGRTIPHPLESDIVITDNQWHHIGVTWDGSYRVLYVDGVEAAKDATPWPLLKSSTGGLHIGADKNIEAETCFSGLIDDVRIHNVALSVDKIAAMAK